ncbi:unnamed protein product [Zymoseptoria tritici ST99CH_3D7]|uniref:Uncharacterized protein n=1 Tax=Zymoseptoria tritici (strain ST99CH_3D7) TaxID=1276538 RepID=A0A1X7RKJ0_ZYMT9|nr:unnamed protein product [Zymoseptoria tritici ST99CH_3D7]
MSPAVCVTAALGDVRRDETRRDEMKEDRCIGIIDADPSPWAAGGKVEPAAHWVRRGGSSTSAGSVWGQRQGPKKHTRRPLQVVALRKTCPTTLTCLESVTVHHDESK